MLRTRRPACARSGPRSHPRRSSPAARTRPPREATHPASPVRNHIPADPATNKQVSGIRINKIARSLQLRSGWRRARPVPPPTARPGRTAAASDSRPAPDGARTGRSPSALVGFPATGTLVLPERHLEPASPVHPLRQQGGVPSYRGRRTQQDAALPTAPRPAGDRGRFPPWLPSTTGAARRPRCSNHSASPALPPPRRSGGQQRSQHPLGHDVMMPAPTPPPAYPNSTRCSPRKPQAAQAGIGSHGYNERGYPSHIKDGQQ